MSRYPGAKWRPLKENATEPAIKPTQLIFHSAVSKADTLWGYFEQDKVVVESHLYVQEDGDAEQYIDTDKQADANYKANIRALSAETWDNGDPDHVPWNPKQLRRLADFAAWAHLEHDIPLVRAPAWNKPGMGGHTDYKEWSNVKGKTCPGLARRGQVDTIIKMAKAIVAGNLKPSVPTTGDIVLDNATLGQLKTMFQGELRTILGNANDVKDKDETHDSLADVRRDIQGLSEKLDGVINGIGVLSDNIAALAVPTIPDTPPADPDAPL